MALQTSVCIATTLDGFIAAAGGSLDWLEHDSGEADYGFNAFMTSIDSVVLGRVTFEKVLGFGGWPYSGKHVIVPSGALTSDDIPPELRAEVEIVNNEPAGLLATLESRGFQHAWVDGGKTIQRFLRAGLIDEITISRIPILIGNGIPLFGVIDSDIRLSHVSTTSFDSGLVQSLYRVGG
ncbi:MAG: dihydrofolate reductase [Chloroflexi bacterium]|nr:dihydrofolate reductase [Chloroflexota bacterium]